MAKAKVNQSICGFTSNSAYAKLGHNETINMYVESTKVEDKGVSRVLYGFGGFSAWKNITGKCRGMHVVENAYNGEAVLFAVFGNHLYGISTAGVQMDLGVVGIGNHDVCFAEVPIYGGDSWLVFVDGSQCFAVNTTTTDGIIHKISLPMRSADDTRIEPNSIAYLYGHLVVNDAKTDAFYTSTYHPLNVEEDQVNFDVFMVNEEGTEEDPRPYYKYGYISYSEYRGDKTLAIVSNGNKMFSMGETSLQVFNYNNVALSKGIAGGVVWSSPNSSCFNVGCSDEKSIAQFGDSFYWVGKHLNGNTQVFTFNGSPVVISNTEIERELSKSVTFEAFTFMVNGHPFYVLSFGDKTYAYDIREGGWINLCSLDQYNATHKFRYSKSVQFGEKLLFATDGHLNVYTEEDFTDCGTPIIRKRIGHIVSDTPIVLQELKPIVNTGDGSQVLRMNFSNDNKSFKMFTCEYAGEVGDYGFEPLFVDLGEGTNFNVELSTTSNVPFVIKDVELVFENLIF